MEQLDLILKIILSVGTVAIWISFLRNLFKGEFGIDIIAGVALISTIIAGQYLAGVVVLIMYTGGQFLEQYAMRRAKKELSLLISRTPTIAHRQEGDEFVDTELPKIVPGNIVLVKPQEIVPIDGIVVEGDTTINESVLTGESAPVNKEKDSLILEECKKEKLNLKSFI